MSNLREMLLCTRRDFLRTGGLLAVGAAMPDFLVRAAAQAGAPFSATAAAPFVHAPLKGFSDGQILLVVQLGGGNDGLNTVVPFTDDAYHAARPRIALKAPALLPLNDTTALNARMGALKGLWDEGLVSIVEGVGYPNPNRSHFRSMEILQTATDSSKFSETGWIGRYLDAACSGEAEPVAGVAIGGEKPQALGSKRGFGVSFADPQSFGWVEGQGQARETTFRAVNSAPRPKNDTLDFLRKVTADAALSSDRVREVARGYKGGIEYPKDAFGASLQTVAKMIAGGLPTRIYYVSLTGFDTHANQVGAQEGLLERFSTGIAAFQRDMRAQGNADRVLTMVFSEFGRRVADNSSGGTDHGTAFPLFLVGQGVHGGLAGARPSLTDLDNGDLKFTTDFRSVYANVISGWLRGNAEAVLGPGFAGTGGGGINLLRAAG